MRLEIDRIPLNLLNSAQRSCITTPKPDTLEEIILINTESQRGRTITSRNRAWLSFHYSQWLIRSCLHAIQARQPSWAVNSRRVCYCDSITHRPYKLTLHQIVIESDRCAAIGFQTANS